jgi:hypothetical protein
MSLDVTLVADEPQLAARQRGVFTREDGRTVMKPDGSGAVEMLETDELFWGNITHNLSKMAKHAGLYWTLWRPEELNYTKARDLVRFLEFGLSKLKESREYYEQFNPSNGWGSYDVLVDFVEKYLDACKTYPDASVRVSR